MRFAWSSSFCTCQPALVVCLVLNLLLIVESFLSPTSRVRFKCGSYFRRNPIGFRIPSCLQMFITNVTSARRDFIGDFFGAVGVTSVSGNGCWQQNVNALDVEMPLEVSVGLEGYHPNEAVTYPRLGRSFFPTITPPIRNRATYRYDLGRGMYALEQLLTFANVTATIRSNVVQMLNGDLFVSGPLYPTEEYCQLLDDLGTVRHVVVPCNALEHKAALCPFVHHYKDTLESVWVAPGQYGPLGQCGISLDEPINMGCQVSGILPITTSNLQSLPQNTNLPPWSDEFEIQTLYVKLPQNTGPVSESAMFHKPTKTLITVDAVVYIPPTYPPIFKTYFPNITDKAFWPKTVLQSVFLPLRRLETNSMDASSDEESSVSSESSSESSDGYSSDELEKEAHQWPGYFALQGKLVRAPILRSFVDARAPDEIRRWVSSIARDWKFDRIVTAHFASPIRASPSQFKSAFGYLYKDVQNKELPQIACQDWDLLQSLNVFIDDNKLGAPAVFDFKIDCIPLNEI